MGGQVAEGMLDLHRASVEFLFTPYTLNGLSLANRIVMSPMTRGFATAGCPSGLTPDYYARRAAGGTGLIITEGVAVNTVACATGGKIPDFHGEGPLATWASTPEAVHRAGGRIMVQLWHTGLLRPVGPGADTPPSVGPSYPLPGARGEDIKAPSRQMTLADIEATIDAYAAAAAAAQRLGFDGVELHGAHGYLIDQFFWAETNLRRDAYGGDLANRTHFCVDIVREIRRRVGPSFPVGLRFSQWKLPDHYGERPLGSPKDLEVFLRPLADSGLDFFDCSTRRYWEPAFEESDLNLAGWTRKLTGMTTMTVGSVGLAEPLTAGVSGHTRTDVQSDLSPLMRMFERGDFDLVAVGRALISDPDWPNHIRAGQLDALRPYSREALAELY